MTQFIPSKSLSNFYVQPIDPGFIYVIQHTEMLKIGRSINPRKRIKEAKTWIPDMRIIGIKPFWNHREKENSIHIGLAQFWKQSEWYDFGNDEFFEYFLDEFRAFDDQDINSNSLNFTYMMNGTGMSEFTLEQSRERIVKSRFLRKNSQNQHKASD